MASRSLTKTRPLASSEEARMKRPMTRAEVHALMKSQASIVLGALNELEGRIAQLEGAVSNVAGTHTTPSGIVLLDSSGRTQ